MIAWIISIILTHITVFINLSSEATTLPSACFQCPRSTDVNRLFIDIIIITIVMTPGMAVGETTLNCFLAAAGVAVGSLMYFIVAHLGQCIPAQAIVIAIIVYRTCCSPSWSQTSLTSR